jgi:hypothetical protein
MPARSYPSCNPKDFPKKIDDTLKDVKRTATNFNAASAQVRQVVTDLTGPFSGRVSQRPPLCRARQRSGLNLFALRDAGNIGELRIKLDVPGEGLVPIADHE